MTIRTAISTLFGCAALAVLLACGSSTPPAPPAVGITISPTTQSLVVSTTQTFTATVTNASNTAVTWSVLEGVTGGAITTGGVYTAPAITGTYHVVVTSVADASKSAMATVTVTGVPANSWNYTDPTTGTYRLVKNTTLSTPTHLVLDLTGVAGDSGAGIAFTLTVDTALATWNKVAVSDAEYVQNGDVLVLGTAPIALKGKVATTTLTAALGQKGISGSKPLTGVLARVALDRKAGATVGPVALTAPKAQILGADGLITNVTVTPGTLVTTSI